MRSIASCLIPLVACQGSADSELSRLAERFGADYVAPSDIDARLASMTVDLEKADPPRFVLRYPAERFPVQGPLCYRFHGYNETCLDLDIGRLSRATPIELYAPGGVPLELLDGYVLIVRFPAMTETEFRFEPR